MRNSLSYEKRKTTLEPKEKFNKEIEKYKRAKQKFWTWGIQLMNKINERNWTASTTEKNDLSSREGREREKRGEILCKEMITKNFLNSGKYLDIQIQD